MLASLAVLGLAVAAGVAVTRLYFEDADAWTLLLGGALTGTLLFHLVGLAAAWMFDLGGVSMGITLAVLGLLARRVRGPWRWLRASPIPVLSTLALAGLAIWLGLASVYQRWESPDPPGQAGIYTFDNNAWDLPEHIGFIESFYRQDNFPPQELDYAGAKFSYHFLMDFGSAQWQWLGLNVVNAMRFENAWCLCLTLGAMGWWAGTWTGDRRAATLAPWLLLCSGGTSATLLWDESGGNGSRLLHLLGHLRHSYTIWDDWRWPNAVMLMLAQRGWLLGVPLLMWIAGLWWRGLQAEPRQQKRLAVAAGLLTAGMPFSHSYSTMILLASAGLLAVLFPCRRLWGIYLATAAVAVALPLGWLLWNPSLHPSSMLHWAPGWDRRGDDPVTFWFHNLGLFIPCLLIGFTSSFSPSVGRFYVPFALLFLAGNLFQVAYWIWDNLKILFPCFAMAVPVVAMVAARLSRQPRYGPAAAAVLMLMLTASGMLECWRIGSRETETCSYRGADVAAAAQISALLPPRSVVLHRPDPKSVMFLCGTLGVLGTVNGILSRGMVPEPRLSDINRIYAGDPQAPALLRQYGVGFILELPPDRVTVPGCRPVLELPGLRLFQVAP